MRKFAYLSLAITIAALSTGFLRQSNTNPFDVQVSGRGTQSIIFIPGLACFGEVWASTRTMFEKDFTCHTLTMAGFAGVPAQPKSSFQNWEKAIATYIQENKISKAIVIGHSMGGSLTMALAADYPELVSKIIVVDALPSLSALMSPSFKAKESNDCSSSVSQFTSISDRQFYLMQKGGTQQMLADTSKMEMVVSWSLKSDRKTLAEMYCDFYNTDLREKIASIKCPALILLEPYFANVKPAIIEQFKNLEKANLQYATKGLHFIMYDDKGWYDSQLISFVK